MTAIDCFLKTNRIEGGSLEATRTLRFDLESWNWSEANQPIPANEPSNSSDEPTSQSFPTVIDQYRLLRVLGGGGAGIVCEAEDTSLGWRVAIKLIPAKPASGAAAPQLLREVWNAGQVQHPNVVSLYDVGIYPGGVYLVMELVGGRSVQPFLGDGPMPWREATAILVAACEGLTAVHARGIIHRDVKPANLLGNFDGTVKLTDFGLSCLLDASRSSAAWKRTVGTPHYMSPEQCREEVCDERTDIYSLGATYHTLLTGRTPYPDATPEEVQFEHCSAPVPDPRQDHREIPSACAKIVQRGYGKEAGRPVRQCPRNAESAASGAPRRCRAPTMAMDGLDHR